MTKWRYGDSWEKFPIEEGETWLLGENSKVAVHNLFNSLPEFVKEIDLLFIDPPWNLGNINCFYTKAGRKDYLQIFSSFYTRLFQCIREINPNTCYIEIGKQNVDVFYSLLDYPYKQKWLIKYYNKHPCYLIRGSYKSEIDFDFTGIDEAKCIYKLAKIENYNVLGDICMGLGLVGLAAFKAGKPFMGTELNKRRLANLISKLSKKGCKIEKLL